MTDLAEDSFEARVLTLVKLRRELLAQIKALEILVSIEDTDQMISNKDSAYIAGRKQGLDEKWIELRNIEAVMGKGALYDTFIGRQWRIGTPGEDIQGVVLNTLEKIVP